MSSKNKYITPCGLEEGYKISGLVVREVKPVPSDVELESVGGCIRESIENIGNGDGSGGALRGYSAACNRCSLECYVGRIIERS